YETAQPSLFPGTTETGRRTINLKDKGQRKACGCIVSKDIGQYNTRMHLCKYCYANYSEKMVRRNYQQKRDVNAESILREDYISTGIQANIVLFRFCLEWICIINIRSL
ncbi:MAG: DUF1848 domain-containing protein, partial [Firmicutes bacterium]|nr:DUF1848 domain-containing protein [Bacillota bacterium]